MDSSSLTRSIVSIASPSLRASEKGQGGEGGPAPLYSAVNLTTGVVNLTVAIALPVAPPCPKLHPSSCHYLAHYSKSKMYEKHGPGKTRMGGDQTL